MANLNVNPYYDDYDESKGFYQILFKPGVAVQARELTQLQSILRNQVARFGSHVFQEGSVVIPGNIRADLTLCYVKLQTVDQNSIPLEDLVGAEVAGPSGLKGKIRAASFTSGSDPDTIWVNYINSGSSSEKVFGNNEALTITTEDLVEYNVTTATSSATGGAGIAYINDGVFFVKGTFARVNKQSLVISKYSNKPNCHVLLKITEDIIDYNDDDTLLDTAQGSYNYAAPGADRYRITLTLTTLPLSTEPDDNYVELMRYNAGVLEEHLRYAQYNELAKNLARRTYDESGDYVVRGLTSKVREHLLSGSNGGRYASSRGGDASKMIYTVYSGKAYISGFENEKIASTELVVGKARGSSHMITSNISMGVSYGQYIYVTNLNNYFPDFSKPVSLTLYNQSGAGSIIGYATAIGVDYVQPNSTDDNAIYKLFLSRITGLNNITDLGRVTFTVPSGTGSMMCLTKYIVSPNNDIDFVAGEVVTFGTRVATVHMFQRSTNILYVYRHLNTKDVPVVGDTITAPSGASARVQSSEVLGKNEVDNLIIELPSKPTYSVTNSTGSTDISYKIYHTTSVLIAGDGTGSFSVSGYTIDPEEQGSFLAVYSNGDTGVVPIGNISVAPDGLSASFTGCTAGATIQVSCAATKSGSNAAPKTKTYTITTENKASAAYPTWIYLDHVDGVQLVSVMAGSTNVTKRYQFSSGRTDYAYNRCAIRLKSGQSNPGGTLAITYRYFTHNAGSGDYFCVDSYKDSGLPNYFESGALFYKSANTGKTYNLREVLDFRPSVGTDGTFSGTGAVNVQMPVVKSRITTSVRSYVGRKDIIIMNKDGELKVIQGKPRKTPILPGTPTGVLKLAEVDVPAYTYKASDVDLENIKNDVYTMKDIGVLERRIENLEEYVTLSQTENDLVNFEIIDANTGLARFKSGYLVDTFNNPDTISDVFNENFKVSYVSEKIIPMFETIEADLTITSQGGAQKTNNNVLTLPYTNEVMAKQPLSSRVTNINPFAVFSWVGELKINPSRDTWSETEYLPPIINNITETITVTRPWNWQPPAKTSNATPTPVVNVKRVTRPTPVPRVITNPRIIRVTSKNASSLLDILRQQREWDAN